MLLVDADQQLVRQRAEEDLEVRYRSDADNWPRETVTRSLARGRLRRFQGLQRKKASQYLEHAAFTCAAAALAGLSWRRTTVSALGALGALPVHIKALLNLRWI